MKTKIILSIVLLFLFFFTLCYSRLAFYLYTTLLSIISLREIIYIRSRNNIPISVEIMSYFLLFFFSMNNYIGALDAYVIDYKLLMLIITTDLIPLVIYNNKKKYNLIDALYIFGATVFIGMTFNILNQVRDLNINYASYIVVIGLTNKIFSFIGDREIGRTKLIPTIIPKRTIEGFSTGFFMGTILSVLFYISVDTRRRPLHMIVVITFVLSFFSQIGDFVFAFMKKEFNKDNFSSHFIKKSGILDLIDSIIFITLGFMLFISIM